MTASPSETSLLTAKRIAKVISDPALSCALLNAQLQMRGRVRVPLSVRLLGKVRIKGSGDIAFGEGITLDGTVVPLEFIAHEGARLAIGRLTFINYGSSISAHQRVEIGDHCLLGHYTLILDNNQHGLGQHHVLPPSAPVVIEDHVWIGSKVTILPGVHIGRCSAIGAGSVVTRDIPPHCLAVGNPARVVRRLDENDKPALDAKNGPHEGHPEERSSMSRPSLIRRAFALARNALAIAVIRQRLRFEGYDDNGINSPVVLRQLRRILIDARRETWKRKLALRGRLGPGSERTGRPDVH